MKKWRIFLKGEEKGKVVGNRLQTPEGTRERDGLRGAPGPLQSPDGLGFRGKNASTGPWRVCFMRTDPRRFHLIRPGHWEGRREAAMGEECENRDAAG